MTQVVSKRPLPQRAQNNASRSVRYREMTREDWDDIFELARRIWMTDIDGVDDEEIQLLGAIIDTSIILKRSAYGIVAEDAQDGHLVGIVTATASEPPPKRVQGWCEVNIAKALARGDEIGDERGDDTGVQLRAFEAEMRRYLALGEEMREKDYDGELALLILDEAYQGLGIGRTLVQRALAWLKDEGCAQVFLETDDSCNYPFYDRLGWRKAQAFDAHVDIFGKRYDIVEYFYELDL